MENKESELIELMDIIEQGSSKEAQDMCAHSSLNTNEMLRLQDSEDHTIPSIEEGPQINELFDDIDKVQPAVSSSLESKFDDLQEQISNVGTFFLDDPSVKIYLEDLVSTMLESRLADSNFSDKLSLSPCKNPDIVDIERRITLLEQRVDEWEKVITDKALNSAAKIIRDEINFLKNTLQ